MKDNISIKALMLVFLFACNSCSKFLDVVPDNVATLDNAFTTRIEAKKIFIHLLFIHT
jgi:hypothetical protein